VELKNFWLQAAIEQRQYGSLMGAIAAKRCAPSWSLRQVLFFEGSVLGKP
jgi:hypothetical protein